MTPTTQPWYTSRTLWIAILTAAVGIFGILTKDFPTVGFFATALGILNFIVRLDTSLPIQ